MDHNHPTRLVVDIYDDRGAGSWKLADDGEAVMVDFEVHEEWERRWATTLPASNDDAGSGKR